MLHPRRVYKNLILQNISSLIQYNYGATIHGRRLPFNRSNVNFVYIETLVGISSRGGGYMLTITELIAVISLIITSFSLGLTIGRAIEKSNNRQPRD